MLYVCCNASEMCVCAVVALAVFPDINIRYRAEAVSTDICSTISWYIHVHFGIGNCVSIVSIVTYCHNHMGCCFKCVLKLKR